MLHLIWQISCAKLFFQLMMCVMESLEGNPYIFEGILGLTLLKEPDSWENDQSTVGYLGLTLYWEDRY